MLVYLIKMHNYLLIYNVFFSNRACQSANETKERREKDMAMLQMCIVSICDKFSFKFPLFSMSFVFMIHKERSLFNS